MPLLTFASWIVSSIYPIIASYKAYDGYALLASKSAATSVNIGGVSIPLGTMIKRATTEGTLEEEFVNSRLLTVQMWMVYWIVHGCFTVVESVLFLTFLPLYSTVRLGISAWLIFPIVVSSTRLSKSQVLSTSDIQNEWMGFSTLGCGMIYFQYVKPAMQGKLGFLDGLNVDSIVNSVGGLSNVPLLAFCKALLFKEGGTSQSPEDAGGNLAQAFTVFSKSFFPSREVDGNTPTSAEQPKKEDIEDYDMVDTPAMSASVDGLTHREIADPTDKGKRTWFW